MIGWFWFYVVVTALYTAAAVLFLRLGQHDWAAVFAGLFALFAAWVVAKRVSRRP